MLRLNADVNKNIHSTDDDFDSIQSQPTYPVTAYCSFLSRLNADMKRTSTRLMMTLTVSSYSLVFYHVQSECGCEQNICSTDDDVDSIQSQSNVLETIKPISPCDVLRD
ncbi:hypothetical protein J6590_066023 [Homalodisca vitripennis]|nr:hypothetical protein J6590_066023 [Homalodisca vitripennis]